MSEIALITVTARTALVLLRPVGTLFALPAPLAWQVTDAAGVIVQSGTTAEAGLFLDGLSPATRYTFACDLGLLNFETADCAGLVDITAYGADPALPCNRSAIEAALDAVPDGGTLLVPPGRFTTRPVTLRSNITLHLAEGAVLAAPASRNNWPILPDRDAAGRAIGTWEGLPEASFASLITAIDCQGLHITGRGTLDGGGAQGDWWTWPKETRDGARRPRVLFAAYCTDMAISGVTICNAPSWTTHLFHSQRVICAGLTIQNPPDSPNTDGLNPECCEDVDIVAVRFSVGDDCIAIKSGKRGPKGEGDHLAPTRGIIVRHCHMADGHGGVVIGSEMSGGVSDVAIASCCFAGTDRGLRIKTRRGRGGAVRNVSLTDVMMDRVATPLAINAFYFCDADGKSDAVQSRQPAPVTALTPRISNIRMRNVTATNVTTAAAAVLGLPEAPITDVALENFNVTYAQEATAEVPLMALGVPQMFRASIYADFAEVTGTITLCADERELATCS